MLLSLCIMNYDVAAFNYFYTSPKYSKEKIKVPNLLNICARTNNKIVFEYLLNKELASPGKIADFSFDPQNKEDFYFLEAYDSIKSKKELEKSIGIPASSNQSSSNPSLAPPKHKI